MGFEEGIQRRSVVLHTASGEPLGDGGQLAVSERGSRSVVESMAGGQTVGTSWVAVYENTQLRASLCSFVINTNTDRMDLRVTLDPGGANEFVALELDLDELAGDFRLDKIDAFDIRRYQAKRWRYSPRNPQPTDAGFKIELRSQQGNKRLERGLVVWREG